MTNPVFEVMVLLVALPCLYACTPHAGGAERTVLRDDERRLLRGAQYKVIQEYEGDRILEAPVRKFVDSAMQRVFTHCVRLEPATTTSQGEPLTIVVRSRALPLSAEYRDGKRHFTGLRFSGTISLGRGGHVLRRGFDGTRPPIFSFRVRENEYLTPAEAASHEHLDDASIRPGGFYPEIIAIVAEVFGMEAFLPLLEEGSGSKDDGLISGMITLGRDEPSKDLFDSLLRALENAKMRKTAVNILMNILEDDPGPLWDALRGSDEVMRTAGLRVAREAAEARILFRGDRNAWRSWWKANRERLFRGIGTR